MMMPTCTTCSDSGWVCENHPGKPWDGDHACGAAGMPCERCNPSDFDNPPRPPADTAAMMFWALLASGQISMRKVDGWQILATKPIDQPIDLAA
jgi:hypothetical protein